MCATEERWTGGVVTTFDCDALGALGSQQTSVGGAPRFSVTYTRDALGRIQQKSETVNGVTHVEAYTYDVAGRLTSVTRDGAPLVSYTYDANGNRLTETTTGGTVTSTYDAQDRLLTSAGATYTYTAAGELRTRADPVSGTTTYTYDVLGNLTTVALPSGTVVNYVVDGANRRIGRRINGALVQSFLYQGQLRPVAEIDGNGTIASRFVYATAVNVPNYFVRGGVTYRIVTDHLGSPRLMMDTSTGQVVQQLDYDPFGRVVLDTNPGFQPFGFAGGLYDPLTGLVRFGARDYDAEMGRWTAKDPVLFEAGDPNLFGYVLADPVNFQDPTGLLTASDFLKIASDFSAGFGDTLTSGVGLTYLFGVPSLTEAIRGAIGVADVVDPCSSAYFGGQIAGYAWGLAASMRWKGSPSEPVHYGLDVPFTRLNLVHYGEHAKFGRHIGLLFSGRNRTFLHFYADRVFIAWPK